MFVRHLVNKCITTNLYAGKDRRGPTTGTYSCRSGKADPAGGGG